MNSSTSSSKALARRYLGVLATTLALAAGAIATFNIVTDPYDVFVSFRRAPPPIRYGSATRMSKAYVMRNVRPDCLVLGTSRAAVGYEPERLGPHCERPYNAGLSKAHIYEVRRYLQHALGLGPVREVLLGLDFELFRNNSRTIKDFSEERLATDAEGGPAAYPANEVLGLALSLDATRQSWRIRRHKPEPWWFDRRGVWRPESLTNSLGLDRSGVHGASRKQAQMLAQLMTPAGAYDLGADGRLPAFAELGEIIRLSRAHGLRLRVVVNPVHIAYHEMLSQLGLLETYEAWKADVGRMLDAELPEHGAWDFDRRNALTTEPLPDATDHAARMRGYWEFSHFRAELGREVIAESLATPAAAVTQGWPPGSLERWRQTQPHVVEAIREWLAAPATKRSKGRVAAS